MKNITVTLDQKTAAWARVYAAHRKQSLSRFLSELLHCKMRESREYDDAMVRFMAVKPTRLSSPGAKYPKREELYDRPSLR